MNQAQAQDNVWNENTKKTSFFDWLSKIGIGLLSLFAPPNENSTEDSYEIESENTLTAGPANEPIPDCCSLYYDIDQFPERECHYEGSRPEYTCPEGYYRQYWPCLEGTRIAVCAECTTSEETCWQGEFNCSIWWWVEEQCQ